MNERIKQLWSQAGGHYNSGNQHTWPQYTIDDPAKFAELIVKECMKLNSKELSITAIERLLPLYREHFGVEE
jgi:hypothetical protein